MHLWKCQGSKKGGEEAEVQGVIGLIGVMHGLQVAIEASEKCV
jgi:hypothetical protein